MRRPPFTHGKIPGTHFCQRLSRHQGYSAAGRIRSIEKCNGLIGNRTRDLRGCSIVSEPTSAVGERRVLVTRQCVRAAVATPREAFQFASIAVLRSSSDQKRMSRDSAGLICTGTSDVLPCSRFFLSRLPCTHPLLCQATDAIN
jgi:hypothetical protein